MDALHLSVAELCAKTGLSDEWVRKRVNRESVRRLQRRTERAILDFLTATDAKEADPEAALAGHRAVSHHRQSRGARKSKPPAEG